MIEGKTPAILLVDDEPGVLKVLEKILEDTEAIILSVHDGETAMRIVEKENIDMIITDQRMPGMTGIDILRKTRNMQPDCVRVLITGYTDIDEIMSAVRDRHINKYFAKPCDITLKEYVMEILDNNLKHTVCEIPGNSPLP